MNNVIKYLANDWEDAVIKVMDNGDRYVKIQSSEEFKAHPESKVANGSIEIELLPISKNEYDTFFNNWHFGCRIGCKKTDMLGNLL